MAEDKQRPGLRSAPRRGWHLAALALILALGVGLAVLAWAVSGHERVRLGTEADRIYIVDGFYDGERTSEHGAYRWSQPLGQLRLPNWGPGRINVSISGVGAGSTPSEAILEIDGVPVDRVETRPGQPWTVSAWGDSDERTPHVSITGPRLDAPGDGRSLGRLVQTLEIFAPDARARSLLHLGLLAAGSFLLYICVWLWTGRHGFALIMGIATLALFGPLAVFRDRWVETVAWTLPIALGGLLLLHWRAPGLPVSRLGPRWRTALAITSLSAALLLLAQGYLNAFDSERMYQMAAGLAEYGLPTRFPGRDTWTKYGFGQSLIAVPFYLLGKTADALGGDYGPVTRFAVSLTNLPLTALLLWVLYRACRRFAGAGVALAVCATFLLTTPTLNYARTFFSEPAGALLLLTSTLLIVPREGETAPTGRRVLLAGACLGAMIIFKPAFIVYWPVLGLAVLWLAWRGRVPSTEHREPGTADGETSIPTNASRFTLHALRHVIRMGALFALGPIVGGLVQIAYNYLRYHDVANSLFRTGYEREEGFTTPLFEGLNGLLFSPGKSLFLYAPVLILAPIGLWLMYRRSFSGRVTASLILALSVVGLVFNALWWVWSGNFAWGPRLIVPILPLLAWALAPLGAWVVNALREGKRKLLTARLTAGAWVTLAGLGALANIPGALVDFQVYYLLRGLTMSGVDPREDPTFYDPAQSPLLVELGYMLDGLTTAVYRPSLTDVGMPPMWDVVVPGALLLIAVGALWLGARPTSSLD